MGADVLGVGGHAVSVRGGFHGFLSMERPHKAARLEVFDQGLLVF
jgi:hypothetical protein